MKKAIITGITGQDGAYLSKLLINKGYEVIGLSRSYNLANLIGLNYLGIKDKVIIEKCDLLDLSNLIKIINKYSPDEVYNLAAQSSVGLSFQQPIGTINFNAISVLNLLEAIRSNRKKIKFYQASSSEMFGKINSLPIKEDHFFHPLSPYAISKASAHWLTVNYRESYKIFTCCGILFNHESYLRSNDFFVKKVLKAALNIKNGVQSVLKVGNIDIKRDFGYAPKYAEAMWLMMQQEKPDNYIICSGKSISLRKIICYIFDKLNISHEKILVDEKLYRPSEIDDIYGDNSKAKNNLSWNYDMDFFDVLDILIEEESNNYKL
ncbi:MAG: GDP-mannose 4,6-dehydratase [Candidatus Wallbacteria bacterium]